MLDQQVLEVLLVNLHRFLNPFATDGTHMSTIKIQHKHALCRIQNEQVNGTFFGVLRIITVSKGLTNS